MATKFFKMTIPEYGIMPNATYADLFDNHKANTDIQSGTVGGIQTTSLFAADYKTAVQPDFGSAKLVGAKVGLFINSITAGKNTGSAGLKAFKLNQEIGNREGGKSSLGTLIDNQDMVQFSSFHSDENYIIEDFSGAAEDAPDTSTERVNTVVTQRIGAYLNESDGYEYGERFGGRVFKGLSKATHHDRYGQTLEDGTKIYKIEKQHKLRGGYKSVKEKKLFWRRNSELYHSFDIDANALSPKATDRTKIKYEREITVETEPDPQQLSTDNSFFDIIKQAEVFRGTKSDSVDNSVNMIRETFGDVVYSSTNVLKGGYSMHMNSVYMHRDNSISSPWYPYMTDTSGNELRYSALQQTSFASKILPMPVEVGNTNDKDQNSQGGHSPIPTIEIDANMESLAPMLVRFENHANALGGARTSSGTDDTGAPMRFRLNRSYAITFGEEPPTLDDTLFTYIKKHIPTAGEAGVETIDSNNATPSWQQNGATQSGAAFTGNGGGTAATATIVCHADIATDEAITLISYAGTSKTYTAKGAENFASNQFDASGTAAETAASLKSAIEHANGHNGEITVIRSPNDTLTLTQGYKGTDGNTTITETFNANATVSAAFTGGLSTKSFFGTAFVNYDGKLCYYDLGPSANFASNSPFDDIGFRTDDVLGEICFTNAPTAISENFNTWVRMGFQVDPELMGAFHSIYDAKKGDVFRSPAVLRNVKTANYTSANANNRKIKVVNRDEWPKYMTIWNNNYQAIKSNLSNPHANYTTGMLHAETDTDGTDRVNVLLYTDSDKDNSNGLKGIPFNLIKPGTSVRTTTSTTPTVSSEVGVASWATTTGDSGQVTVVTDSDKDTTQNQPFLYDALFEVDSEVQGVMDMTNSMYIDNIHLKHFNIQHSNATPNENNPVTGRLKIPEVHRTMPFGYTLNNTVPTNVNESGSAIANSYLCFGFDNYTDLGFATNISSSSTDKDFLMNDFNITTSSITDKIITNTDSEQSHVRAGYSSSADDYGIQGRSKLTQSYGGTGTQDPTSFAKVDAHAGYARTGSSGALQESPFFDNNEGTPNYEERGLKVGDDSNGYELAIGSDTAYQIDRFTQKGILTWNFDARTTDSTSNINNGGGSQMDAGDLTVVVTDGTDFVVNQFIKIDNEVMKVTAINSNTLTVTRGQYGTTDTNHAHDTDIYHIAVPEKRECLFVSARVLEVINEKTIRVDSPSIFTLKDSTEYVIYKHGDSHASPTFELRTVKVTSRDENTVTFDRHHGMNVNESTKHDIMISPKKFWFVMELTNVGGEITKTLASTASSATTITLSDVDRLKQYMAVKGTTGFIQSIDTANNQVTLTGTTISGSQNSSVTFEATVVRGNNNSDVRAFLPERSYDNIVGVVTDSIDSDARLGATFNEGLFNDGVYLNNWNLEAFEDTTESIISLDDYGFGNFDKEKDLGGHAGFLALNIQNDITKFKEIDVSGVVTKENIEPNSTIPLLISTDDPSESFKINVDTEDGTNKTYLLSVFEDELPKITEFKLQPNKEDPYFIDFTWNCQDEDAWYGFILLDDEKGISNQYKGAIIHLPLNEEGAHGTDAGTIANEIGNISTSAGGGTDSRKPHYTVEGLAGYALQFDGSDDSVNLGATGGTDDPFTLADNGIGNVTDEFSVVAHIVHDGTDVDSNGDYIIKKNSFELFVDQNEQIVARFYSDADSALQLISTSKVQAGIPMNIIATFDSLLTEGNCKLFINGRLEDISGVVVSSHGNTVDNTITGWILGTNLYTADGVMLIGNKTAAGTTAAFDGKIEELVFYNEVIYPVNPKTGKFTLTKPLSELNATTNASSKSYSARLFVKDYHNIRGKTSLEVAASPVLNFRKAAFDIDAS